MHNESWFDQIVDELLPGDFDWREKVRRYPIPALAVAAAGGFFLGRTRGRHLLGAMTRFAADEASANITSFLSRHGDPSEYRADV